MQKAAIPNVPNGVPSDRLVRAVADAKSKYRLCAATGRPIANATPILSRLNLTDPCIISAGTQIVDPETDRIIWEASLNDEDAALGTMRRVWAIYGYRPGKTGTGVNEWPDLLLAQHACPWPHSNSPA